MTRKKTNTRKRTGKRRKSVVRLEWDEAARREAGRVAYGQGGYFPTAYASERGAKGRAAKSKGTVIAKQGDHVFYWYPEADRVPAHLQIVSVYEEDRMGGSMSWKGVSHSPGQIIMGNIRQLDAPTTMFTNIDNVDDKRLREFYESAYNNMWDQESPPDQQLLQSLNRELSRSTMNRASSTYAGSTDDADIYYVHYFGKPLPEHGGAPPLDQMRRTASAVKGTVAFLPFIYESSIGDISGEGDYVTHLVVMKEDAKFD
jgi:hypothetical protein